MFHIEHITIAIDTHNIGGYIQRVGVTEIVAREGSKNFLWDFFNYFLLETCTSDAFSFHIDSLLVSGCVLIQLVLDICLDKGRKISLIFISV
jgi:hypothetical protein